MKLIRDITKHCEVQYRLEKNIRNHCEVHRNQYNYQLLLLFIVTRKVTMETHKKTFLSFPPLMGWYNGQVWLKTKYGWDNLIYVDMFHIFAVGQLKPTLRYYTDLIRDPNMHISSTKVSDDDEKCSSIVIDCAQLSKKARTERKFETTPVS